MFCKAQDTDSLRDKLQQLFKPYRGEKQQQIVDLLASDMPDKSVLEQSEFFKQMQQFYEANEPQYCQRRLKSLMRYPSAPKEFPGYTPIADTHIREDYNRMGSLCNFLFLDVEEYASVIQSTVFGDIVEAMNRQEKDGLTNRELLSKIGFGILIFTDKLQDDVWKVTEVNRAYAISFDWNIRTDTIDNLKTMIYTGAKQKPGWLTDWKVKSGTPQQKLLGEMAMCRWSLYDHKDTADELQMDHLMSLFFAAHKNQYTNVRNAFFSKLPTVKVNWQNGYQKDDAITQETLNDLGIFEIENRKLSPQISSVEMGCDNVFNTFKLNVMRADTSYNIKGELFVSWVLGNDVYTRKISEQVWDIVGFFHNYALHYRWDIATDDIVVFDCWRKTYK
ncbi:MAG: hypothetical protein QM610_16115 [Chitinophagaceae bacterium]